MGKYESHWSLHIPAGALTQSAEKIWNEFCERLAVSSTAVRLFDLDDSGVVRTRLMGSAGRRILYRSPEIESLIRAEVTCPL